MESKVYPAKIDWWLWLILMIASPGLIVFGALTWSTNQTEALILIGAGIFDAILVGLLLFPCFYAIEDSTLLIRFGVFRYRVPIKGIESLTLTTNPISAPAPSLQRVEIRMKTGKFYLVSPIDREGFIKEVNHLAGITAKD